MTNLRITGMILLQALVVGAIGYCLGIAMTATFFEMFQEQPRPAGFSTAPGNYGRHGSRGSADRVASQLDEYSARAGARAGRCLPRIDP